MAKESGEQMSIPVALVRAAFLVDAVYAEASRDYGLTSQQGQLLCVLMSQPYGMGELGAMLGLAKSSLTGLVDRTERRGLVQRVPDPDDRRAVKVALSEEGAKLVEPFYEETCRRVEALTADLGEADRQVLAGLLSRLVVDNEVPVVFVETVEVAPTEH
jgi:DNA-binding MarR family transcriptional regulator